MNLSRRFFRKSPHPQTRPGLCYLLHDVGADVTLLLLHGVTRLSRDWTPVFPALSALGNVYALDFRGHGESERASSYLVTDYAEDVLAFLRAETDSPVVIVGHSLGAMVAAAVAARLPEHVRALVLEDPPFETMGARIIGSAWQHQFIGMQSVVRGAADGGGIADRLADVPIPQPGGTWKKLVELRTRASLEWSAECLKRVDPEVFTPLIEGRWLQGYHQAEVLGAIRCPTLLMQADPESGGALTDADASEAMAAIPNCHHVRLSGTSHQLHRDHSEAFLSCATEFIVKSLR